MPILKGFPPSNTISPGQRFPTIVKTKIVSKNLKPRQRFIYRGATFYVLELVKSSEETRPLAICYRGCKKSCHSSGSIYSFNTNLEVTLLKEVW